MLPPAEDPAIQQCVRRKVNTLNSVCASRSARAVARHSMSIMKYQWTQGTIDCYQTGIAPFVSYLIHFLLYDWHRCLASMLQELWEFLIKVNPSSMKGVAHWEIYGWWWWLYAVSPVIFNVGWKAVIEGARQPPAKQALTLNFSHWAWGWLYMPSSKIYDTL